MERVQVFLASAIKLLRRSGETWGSSRETDDWIHLSASVLNGCSMIIDGSLRRMSPNIGGGRSLRVHNDNAVTKLGVHSLSGGVLQPTG